VLNISVERVCVRLLTGDRGFESISLQRRVSCKPEFSSRHPIDDVVRAS
jgi:hypothetical protein